MRKFSPLAASAILLMVLVACDRNGQQMEEIPDAAGMRSVVVVTPDAEDVQPMVAATPSGEDAQPMVAASPDAEDVQPAAGATPDAEDVQPIVVATPDAEDVQPIVVATPDAEDLQPAAGATPDAEHVQPIVVATPDPEDLQTAVATAPGPEDSQPAATATPEPEDVQPTATATPEPEDVQPTATATPEPEDVQPTATATPEPEDAQLTMTATPELGDVQPTATATPEPEEIHPIIQMAVDAMKSVKSYRFSEHITSIENKGRHQTDSPVITTLTFDGAYEKPGRFRRNGSITIDRNPGLTVVTKTQYSDGSVTEDISYGLKETTELGFISMGDIGYALNHKSGLWKVSLNPLYTYLRSSKPFFKGRFFSSSELPSQLFVRMVTNNPEFSIVGQEMIDNVHVHHLSSVNRSKHAPGSESGESRPPQINVWIGIDDMLVRRMSIYYEEDYGPCTRCITGYVRYRSNRMEYEFSGYSTPTNITAPELEDTVVVTNFGLMEVFKSEVAPLSIQYPAGWREGWRDCSNSSNGAYKLIECSPSGITLKIAERVFDAEGLKEYGFNKCAWHRKASKLDSVSCRLAREAVRGFSNGEPSLGTFVEALSHGWTRPREMQHWPDRELVSFHLGSTEQGLPVGTVEIFSELFSESATRTFERSLTIIFLFQCPDTTECKSDPNIVCKYASLIVTYSVKSSESNDSFEGYEDLRALVDYTARTAQVDDR